MVIVDTMNKPTLKVSVSDTDSSSEEESGESENEVEMEEDSVDEDAASVGSEDDVVGSTADSEADADTESENDSENDDSKNNELLLTNEGWADSVAKILGSSKPKNKKTLVLSRAKKHSEIVKKEQEEKPDFEVVGDSEVKEEKPDVKKEETESSEPPVKRKKNEKPSIRVKPNILEKDRERLLSKIATKGVVQLFNAVRNHQKSVEKEVNRNDISEAKKEKILKKFDKRTFLDTLMGQSKSIVVDEATKTFKDEVKEEENKPKWNALRDDFMTGAKLKDWDKESVDE